MAAGEGLPGIASNMNVLRVISAEQTLCAPWLVRELQEAEGQALAAIATVRSTLGGWQQVPAQGWTPCLAEADAGAEYFSLSACGVLWGDRCQQVHCRLECGGAQAEEPLNDRSSHHCAACSCQQELFAMAHIIGQSTHKTVPRWWPGPQHG